MLSSLKRPRLLAAVASGVLLAAQFDGQEAPPAFAARAAAITVDVVVLDDAGQPVRGLTRADFTIFEDGHPQTIVGFEAHDAAAAVSAAQTAPPAAGRVATNNAADAQPSAVFALLIDDVGLSPATLLRLKPAIRQWLLTRAQPRDEVTLMTTSGEVWWSDLAGRGRDELLQALERVTPKRPPAASG